MENFVDWLFNGSPTWAAYREFMSCSLIALDKQPGGHRVGVRESWRCLFDKIILKVTLSEATIECQDDQLCDRLKAGINGSVHRVQAIWYKNRTT